jgi:hypothetical protein
MTIIEFLQQPLALVRRRSIDRTHGAGVINYR